MTAIIIDGKQIAADIQSEIAQQIAERVSAGNAVPGLATVLVGDDPASHIHVHNKIKTCEKLGIKSFSNELPANTTQEELEHLITILNEDAAIHGILVQLPLPEQINEEHILHLINPRKDVDGIHPYNIGLLSRRFDTPLFFPCTPSGIIYLIKTVQKDLSGMNAVVIGRSAIVGMPTSLMLSRENATVTICHSYTKGLEDICRNADILVAATGVPHLVKGDWVKPGAIVIDVGINRIPDPTKIKGYHLTGDTDFDVIKEKARAITPVPGGVGPMTITMLMRNTVIAAEKYAE